MGNDQFIDTFKEEALELLSTLESTLLELEENPTDKELLSAVFRVMHTIKGSAAMFGLDQISAFSHEVESILAALRDGRVSVSRELIDNTLYSRDCILEMLKNPASATGAVSPELQDFLNRFRESVGFQQDGGAAAKEVPHRAPASALPPDAPVTPRDTDPAASSAEAAPPVSPAKLAADGKKPREVWHIGFKPGKDTFRRGSNPFALLNEIGGLGECVCIPDFRAIESLNALDPEDCLCSWEIYLTTAATENDIRDVFIFVEDFSEVSVECLADMIDENSGETKKLGEILVQKGKIKPQMLERLLNSQKRIGELLVEEKLVSPNDLRSALEEQKQLQKLQKSKATAIELSTIRVKSEKLDQLMGLVGELVTVHARIQQTSRIISNNDELVSVVEQFGRLTDELRSNTMSIRMVPIGTTFSNFKRLVRDLSGELGKNVELVTEGGETELDKTVIEKLNDPLIHIIRNSLDHGIEMPEVRAERKKPVNGTIRMSASQTGASVYIVIEDDGNGINKEAVLRKAISKGILKPEDSPTEQEIFQLIFAPGFSTKEQVTAVSGRGVGMDVVNRQMELISGTISIESKEKQFTRITLKIPLTLAIIDGMLVRIGAEHFVIPLSVVEGCLEFIEAKQQNDHKIVLFHDKQLPYVNLREFFRISGERQRIEQMVVVAIKNQLVGLLVDQVIGGNQTVIKPLGKLFKRAEGVSSGTVLGDGSVALILDVEQIVEATEREEG